MRNITHDPEKPNKSIRKLPSVFDSVAAGMLFLYVAFIAVLVLVDVGYIHPKDFFSLFSSEDLRYAMRLSLITSTTSALLSLLVGLPVGYALSRFKFRGKIVVDTLVDLPIVLPPLVIGVSLLVFFQTAIGRMIEDSGLHFVYTPQGIVLAQFTVVSAYAIRTIKVAFDGIDPRLESVARTLGWSRLQAFFRVTL
jgi:molybdate transport system permease protein